ncbi:MAG: Methyltransferase domain [Phormidesmis priestleyi Ana]|uniref:Methyltransferase domain n=1 Tax=Phormidesmis priestleyi Ana TaxID=1666911 RepID=A0A0P8C3H5_9CYAN|nr:MAG: Methyltransferase domain [Phormidesmis priestleyi Ana]
MNSKAFDEKIIGTPSPSDRLLYEFKEGSGRRGFNSLKPKFFNHGGHWRYFAENANFQGCNFLEIGSREVTGVSKRSKFIPLASYTGLDVLPGHNVDVVGDAHRLSSHFKKSTFDYIYSTAVFEHLAMPWVVVEEISKILKVGGIVGIETHFSHSEHEAPWHFFQFNEHGLRCLFCPELGFEVLDSGMETPLVGRFSIDSPQQKVGHPVYSLFCHSSVLVRKTSDVDLSSWDWRICLERLFDESMYPSNTGIHAQQQALSPV